MEKLKTVNLSELREGARQNGLSNLETNMFFLINNTSVVVVLKMRDQHKIV
jgi:hypothetical protein